VAKDKENTKIVGRPQKDIDWDDVDNLCQIQCTGEEIASFLNMDYDTLQRACKRKWKVSFADYIGEKKKGGRASLRRRQWEAAENLNPTMLIWLGKNMLDQKDRQEAPEDEEAVPIAITFTVKDAVADIKITNARTE